MQSSLQRDIKSWDSYREGPQPPAPGMKHRGSGVGYMLLGLALGVIGVARVIALLPAAWSLISGECGDAATVGLQRGQVAIGVVAGIAAVICAEVGTRRERGAIVWLGMVGSILGIFATLVGGALAFLLLLPGECG